MQKDILATWGLLPDALISPLPISHPLATSHHDMHKLTSASPAPALNPDLLQLDPMGLVLDASKLDTRGSGGRPRGLCDHLNLCSCTFSHH